MSKDPDVDLLEDVEEFAKLVRYVQSEIPDVLGELILFNRLQETIDLLSSIWGADSPLDERREILARAKEDIDQLIFQYGFVAAKVHQYRVEDAVSDITRVIEAV